MALTVFAFMTSVDLTICRGLIFTISITLLFMILFIIIFPSRILFTIVAAVAVVLISIFIIYDTQLIAGNKKYKLEYDDYIIGAVLLYSDIVTLFLWLLSLMGSSQS